MVCHRSVSEYTLYSHTLRQTQHSPEVPPEGVRWAAAPTHQPPVSQHTPCDPGCMWRASGMQMPVSGSIHHTQQTAREKEGVREEGACVCLCMFFFFFCQLITYMILGGLVKYY